MRIDYYLRWGSREQERKTITVLMDDWRLEAPDLEFDWLKAK